MLSVLALFLNPSVVGEVSQHKSWPLPENPCGDPAKGSCTSDEQLSPTHTCQLAARRKSCSRGGASQPPRWAERAPALLALPPYPQLASLGCWPRPWGALRSAAFKPGQPPPQAVVLAWPQQGWEAGINHASWGPLLGTARRLPGCVGPGGPAAPLVGFARALREGLAHSSLGRAMEFLPVCG